jgi:hypothetical protein
MPPGSLPKQALFQYTIPFICKPLGQPVHVIAFALGAQHDGRSYRPEHDVRHDLDVHVRPSPAAHFQFFQHLAVGVHYRLFNVTPPKLPRRAAPSADHSDRQQRGRRRPFETKVQSTAPGQPTGKNDEPIALIPPPAWAVRLPLSRQKEGPRTLCGPCTNCDPLR